MAQMSRETGVSGEDVPLGHSRPGLESPVCHSSPAVRSWAASCLTSLELCLLKKMAQEIAYLVGLFQG